MPGRVTCHPGGGHVTPTVPEVCPFHLTPVETEVGAGHLAPAEQVLRDGSRDSGRSGSGVLHVNPPNQKWPLQCYLGCRRAP